MIGRSTDFIERRKHGCQLLLQPATCIGESHSLIAAFEEPAAQRILQALNLSANGRHTLARKRVILIGTSGFGFATAEKAASEGAQIVIASSRQERVDSALKRLPDSAEGYRVDLTRVEQVNTFFDQVGPFDHLVFTAGETLQLGELAVTTLEQAKEFFNIRFWGAFMTVRCT